MESVHRISTVNMKIKFRGQWTTEFIWNIFDDAFLKIQFDFYFLSNFERTRRGMNIVALNIDTKNSDIM